MTHFHKIKSTLAQNIFSLQYLRSQEKPSPLRVYPAGQLQVNLLGGAALVQDPSQLSRPASHSLMSTKTNKQIYYVII